MKKACGVLVLYLKERLANARIPIKVYVTVAIVLWAIASGKDISVIITLIDRVAYDFHHVLSSVEQIGVSL